MALSRTVKKYSPAIGPGYLYLLLGLSGTYTTGGDTCDLTPGNMLDPGALGVVVGQGIEYGLAPTVPPDIQVASVGGYYGTWVPGTTAANGKIQFFSANGTELTTATAYPAAMLAATVLVVLAL